MGEHEDKIYGFGDFRLQTEDGTLWRGEERIPLTQKAVEMLTILVENPGRVVTRENLIERLWPETYVDENNLAVTASMLRKALGTKEFIETVPRKGYRFNSEVAVSTNGFVVAEREYTRAVIEHTEIDDEGANAAIAHLNSRARRQTVYLAGSALFIIVLAAVLGWTFFREGRGQPHTGNRSIAVLPFRDLTAGEDNKYFAIGLADSLITKLAGLSDLTVRPTSSVTALTDDKADIAAMRDKLKVESLLEGTIQRGGGRLRVSVQLVNASDGAVVWADSFEEAENDVFKLQDAIVTRVFAALRVEVSPKQKESFARRESINPEANSLYVKARFYWNKRNPENLKKAVELFEQAVEKDPNFALGFVGVSDGYQMLSEYGGIDRKSAMEKARAAIKSALEIDGEMGEAHCSLGYLQAFYDWDFTAAEASFKKAISLSPRYATAHQWYGEFLNSQGRSDDGLSELNRAAEIDPLSPIILTDIAANYYTARKYDEAIAAVAKVDEIAPKFPFAYYLLALAYEKKGMKTEALRMYYIADSSWFPSLVKSTEADYLDLGYEALAQKRYREVTTPPLAMFTNGYQKAMGALLTGDRDAVFRHLEDSLASRDRWFINLKNDPQWDELRTDDRFAGLLKRAGLGE